MISALFGATNHSDGVVHLLRQLDKFAVLAIKCKEHAGMGQKLHFC